MNKREVHIVGGLEGEPTPEAIEEAILRIPTPFKINPDDAMSAQNRKKVNVIEMCNPLFAKKALGAPRATAHSG